MTNQEAIEVIKLAQAQVEWECPMDYATAFDMAISALQAQDSKTRICDTCKHNPPSKKWPCVDCDMREPADRWEQKDVPDINVGDTISRQAAIDALDCINGAEEVLRSLPSAEPDGWLEQNKDKILQAGMEGREIDFRICGRLFAIREKAQ